ncbi:MAG: hypothetical protein R3C46_14875 [Hyphomonadaceae bacterium]
MAESTHRGLPTWAERWAATTQPSLMLLLGIRAAVRRGLTVVIVEEDPKWNELPFNIKDLLVLRLSAGMENDLAEVLFLGWMGIKSNARAYRDLPVFDSVRHGQRRTQDTSGNASESFTLCSFNEDYLSNTLPQLRSIIKRASLSKDAKNPKEYSVRPVTEYRSPLLVGERIYEMTRFAERCLVDWTGWRPNVFFELGVRLAVNQNSSHLCH